MSQASILSFFGSNLVEKGAQKHKSLDVTEGPSATKSPICLSSNEDVQQETGGDTQSQRQSEKVGHKMAFLCTLFIQQQQYEGWAQDWHKSDGCFSPKPNLLTMKALWRLQHFFL